MARYLFLIVLMISWSCGQAETGFHHTPFARTNWKPLAPTHPHGNKSESRDDSKNIEETNIREKMVAAAEALLEHGEESAGYGAKDLEKIFTEVGLNIGWRAVDQLDALVSFAKKKSAYQTGDDPKAGDIVLFHNQVDANGNGLVDDWLTGCGVVVDLARPQFDAVVRTGHAPRKVTVWPDGPSRNTVSGETTNSYLRVPNRSDPKDTMYLAGQLYAGYIDIERLASGS